MIARTNHLFQRFGARIAAILVLALALPALLTSCSFLSGPTLRVLAGSEVKDLEDSIIEAMRKSTGITIEFEYIGTLDGTEALLNSDERPWDATWFPSNRYLSLFPEGEQIIEKSESIMRSPVVLGLRADVAQELGWSDDNQPTWQEVVDAVEKGDLTYGMTSPISSNSGFTTLVQMSTALSGTGTVLAPEDIESTLPDLKRFAAGQQLASGSSGWLLDKYLENPDAVDGIFNYESVLRDVQVDGKPLQIVIPSDGVITSDYPLTLLKGADEETRANFDKVTEFLLSDGIQQRIADETGRRTTATPPAVDAAVFELPFPNQLDTVQDLLGSWLSEAKKPSNMVFAIDTSGSMSRDDRMQQLNQALDVLSGPELNDGSSASFLRLQPRESITYLEFSHELKSEFSVSIPSDEAGYREALDEIRSHVSNYSPYGGTSVYSTVALAYDRIVNSKSDDSISSIVVFTDGESNEGMSAEDFRNWYRELVHKHPEAAKMPVFTVHFGDSNRDELDELAQLTGGRTFDGTSDSLRTAFREIRGYL